MQADRLDCLVARAPAISLLARNLGPLQYEPWLRRIARSLNASTRKVIELNDNGHGESTGAQLIAAREALQQHAESLLGRLLFAYAQLESALDLCLVWIGEGKGLDERTRRIERLSFAGKLALLEADVHRLASGKSARVYRDWLARTHAIRERRNILVHGRLGLDVHRSSLTVVLSRATSTTFRSVDISLIDLEGLIVETARITRAI